mgnify:CR=1 FL=1
MGIPYRKNRKTEIYKLYNSVSCRTVIYFHYYSNKPFFIASYPMALYIPYSFLHIRSLAKIYFRLYNNEYIKNGMDGKKLSGFLKENRSLAGRAAERKQQVTPEPAGRPVRRARYALMSGLSGYLGGTAEVSFVLWDERVFIYREWMTWMR